MLKLNLLTVVNSLHEKYMLLMKWESRGSESHLEENLGIDVQVRLSTISLSAFIKHIYTTHFNPCSALLTPLPPLFKPPPPETGITPNRSLKIFLKNFEQIWGR